MREIYIYEDIKSWINETPTTSIRGIVVSKGERTVEIQDDSGYTQIINLEKLFALVY